ncbi:hypothetical protein [Salinarimonas chemoclinalis]|uniref:hypothetical protein n=1 Tax=Salinarimonas chemoclinalis TaxID=3241599 RepID=UPI003557A35E
MAAGDMDDDLAASQDEARTDAPARTPEQTSPESTGIRRPLAPADRLAMSRADRAMQTKTVPTQSLDDIREGLM